MYSLSTWQLLGGYIPAHGQQVFVIDSEEQKSQTPVLLLHGYPCSSWDFSSMYDHLSQNHRVIAPDFLGFGFSSKPYPHSYNVKNQANIVEAILAQRGIKKCHVITHNYGDAVVQELLARQNSLQKNIFCSVTFLGCSLYSDLQNPTLMQRSLSTPFGSLIIRLLGRRFLTRSYTALFGQQTQPSTEQLQAAWQLINYDVGLKCLPTILGFFKEREDNKERWQQALTNTSIPLALIRGKADPVSKVEVIKRFQQLPGTNNRVVELTDIGHYPHVEAPDKVLAAWQDFAQSLKDES